MHLLCLYFCFSLLEKYCTKQTSKKKIWFLTLVFEHFSKSDKQGWLTRWSPWSFTKPTWYSDTICLHWSVILPLCFHLLYCSLTIGFLIERWLFVLFVFISWVIETINQSINQSINVFRYPCWIFWQTPVEPFWWYSCSYPSWSMFLLNSLFIILCNIFAIKYFFCTACRGVVGGQAFFIVTWFSDVYFYSDLLCVAPDVV